MTMKSLGLLAALMLCATLTAQEPAVRIVPANPGNIFGDWEEVVISLPVRERNAWRVVDYDGKTVKEGHRHDGLVKLGKMPVGYYELWVEGQARPVTVGVVANVGSPLSAESPICVDAAMSWFYTGENEEAKMGVRWLFNYAGVSWVRDRLAWAEMEPRRGEFTDMETRYDRSARVSSRFVLQVNHSTPAWAGDPKRFPPDLRDAHRFHHAMAARWQESVYAFEPWNEADIDVFGGHTGAEMASMQKASYLGIKAGDPEAIGCLNVFATNRQSTLDDLDANEAWPYFDTFNLHHYVGYEQYPAWYEPFRKISAGRPLWVTEFAMPVKWSGDEKDQEPSAADLKLQAERLPQAFAASIHEGASKAFYFILGHYVEGQTQFGIVKRDLTPRPAYLALAAAGRHLRDAKPLGRIRQGDIRAFAFRTMGGPFGEEPREVIVAWTARGEAQLELPAAPREAFDHLGRTIDGAKSMPLTTRPVYLLFTHGTLREMKLDPPPPLPAKREGKPSPIILQSIWPKDRVSLARSAYRISSKEPQRLPVFLYNFSDAEASGKLGVTGPKPWKLSIPPKVSIKPGDRIELALEVDCAGYAPATTETVTIRGDFGPAGRPVLSLRLQPEPVQLPPDAMLPIRRSGEAQSWHTEVSAGSKCTISSKDGVVHVESTLAPGDRWAYPRIDLRDNERAPAGIRELHFKLSAIEGEAHYRVILVEEGGASYVGELVAMPKPGLTIDAAIALDQVVFGTGWSPPDANGRLDIDQIRSIKIGLNTKAQKVVYSFGSVAWVK